MQKCVYALATSATNDHESESLLRSPPCSNISPLTNASSYLECPVSSKASPRSTSAFVESDFCVDSDTAEFSPGLSNADLYHHYLQHTSRTLTHCQRDQGALQVGMPTLALQSKTVFHSLLALSATCLCCDMISKESSRDPTVISQILTTAYRHYNLASARMRELMSRTDTLKPEVLLASNILLVPFASGIQQVIHWISTRCETKVSPKLLCTTPRDVTVIMRGARTMVQELVCDGVSPSVETPQEVDFATDSSPWSQEHHTSPPALPPSRTHVMYPILAATSQRAFSKLQERLAFASLCRSSTSCGGPGHKKFADDDLSACFAAFEVLSHIGTSAFFSSKVSKSTPSNNTNIKSLKTKEISLPQVTPWLCSYIRRSAMTEPTGPLTRLFLSFLVQTPQAYLDLVLPLLDQRLENPIEDISMELTVEQALALDIYAHWSVLMFLIEDESWWIGNLPVVTLNGMLNRYGYDFVASLWPDYGHKREQWWPGSMLTILQEVKRCK
jgi:hypothetical protein